MTTSTSIHPANTQHPRSTHAAPIYHPHTHTSTHPHIHTSTHPHIHTSTHPHTHTPTHPHPHTHTPTHPHTTHTPLIPHSHTTHTSFTPYTKYTTYNVSQVIFQDYLLVMECALLIKQRQQICMPLVPMEREYYQEVVLHFS